MEDPEWTEDAPFWVVHLRRELLNRLDNLETTIMSDASALSADVSALTANVAALGTDIAASQASIQAELDKLQAQIGAGTPISAADLQGIVDANTSLSKAAADITALGASVPTPPAPPVVPAP